VSALGHYLEEEGIPTVAISLIRAQTENTRPPRALWVPFELGRPFGPPSDAAFQKREMSAVLTLRFAVDDLKAAYIEVALSGSANPSSKQLGDWFWNKTAAGAAIFALRSMYLTSEDERLKAIASLFLVPGVRVPPSS